MINLFENYTQETKDLHISLLLGKIKVPTVVINDDGFLPNDVTSPLQFFLKQAGARLSGKPLYFNQVPVPKYWAIQATARGGKVLDHGIERAQIKFATADNSRSVKQVTWLGDTGQARVIDRYNQWGWQFAQTICDQKGKPVLTTYRTEIGKEVMVKNHLTGTIVANQPNGKLKLYPNWPALVADYLRQARFNLDQVNFNTLNLPFFTLNRLGDAVGLKRLFWQEGLLGGIPGNMQFMLDGKAGRYEIKVQQRQVYKQLNTLLPINNLPVSYLGYAYAFKRLNHRQTHALILTNSDQIEQLAQLVKALPEMTFAIGAITEMSGKLLAFGRYQNVRLYPQIRADQVESLVKWADYYLDINHQDEILNAVRQAFENNMLISAFTNTMHQSRYVAPENIYEPSAVNQLIINLRQTLRSPDVLEERLQAQWKAANRAFPKDYQSLIKD